MASECTRPPLSNVFSSREFLTIVISLFLLTQKASPKELTSYSEDGSRHLLSISSGGGNGFDAFDTDHNGVIDRNEYESALSHFETSLLSGFSPKSSDSSAKISANSQQIQALAAPPPPSPPSPEKKPALINTNNGLGSSGMGAFPNLINEDREVLKFWPAFVNSLSMIIATEIGDKTFFIAAVLSMKNSRLFVFGGAILALICMTILSSMMGLVLPSFLPRKYTHIIGGILFLYFGFKLIIESRSMSDGKCSDELEEVEEELLQQSSKKDDVDVQDSTMEVGGVSSKTKNMNRTTNDVLSKKIFMQSFSMTFLAEWGDRSQIATIALAAAKDPLGVNVGGILGHSLCTGMAVIGGRMLAAKIEEKTVTKWSGIIFLGFGVHSLFFETV